MRDVIRFLIAPVLVLLTVSPTTGGIIDFNRWTPVEDPAHPKFIGSIDSASQVTLSAIGGPIPAATDIGYQSVDGQTPAASTQGYFFDPAADFSVALDFSMEFANPNGTLAFGFGIGEDRDGSNSAGATLVTVNGNPFSFAAAARIDDVTQTPKPILVTLQNSARLIASYDAASGDVTLGVDTNFDSIVEGSATFAALQNDWNGDSLLVSFFLRSDDGLAPAWSSGTADVTVTNFQVISGSPISVPEPQSAVVLLGLCVLFMRRRSIRPSL
jgi:hypothetical protein